MALQPVIPFGRVFPDYPVDAAGKYRPPTATERRAALAAYFGAGRPVLYECGGCGAFHPADFAGDCREDLLSIPDPWSLLGQEVGCYSADHRPAGGWIEVFPFDEDEGC